MDQNPKSTSLAFGDFPGGVSIYEKPPRKPSPHSEHSTDNQFFHALDQQRNTRTHSDGEVDYKDELDLVDEFGVHSKGFTDTDQNGFPTPLSFKLPVWHFKQASGALAVSPLAGTDSHPFEDNDIGKQLASMNGSPLSQAANVMQPVNVGYTNQYGQQKHDTCRAGSGCDPMRRHDSSYCSDEDHGIAHLPCAKCTISSAYTPAATLSDTKKNAETLERSRISIITSDCHRHGGCCVEHHGGETDEATFHNYNRNHHQGNQPHCSNSHAMYNVYPMSSQKTPTVPERNRCYPGPNIAPQKSMDMQNYMHSNHRNDMSCCSHVDGQYHLGSDVASHRHHCDARHKNCGPRRPAPIDVCGPFCRELHGEQIFPNDDPPPSHMMGKGKYNPLYKTEMCRNWSEMGHCRYGRTCQFAHGRTELRQVPRHNQWKTKTCGAWLNDNTVPKSVDMEPQPYGMSRFAGFFKGGFNTNE